MWKSAIYDPVDPFLQFAIKGGLFIIGTVYITTSLLGITAMRVEILIFTQEEERLRASWYHSTGRISRKTT